MFFFSPMSRPNLKLYQPYPFDCTWTFLKWCLKLDGIQSLTLLKVCLKRLGETTKWMHSTSVFLGDQFKIISIYIYIPKDPWECDIYLHMKCGCLLEIKVNTQKSILFDKKSSRKFQGPQDTYQTLREVSTLWARKTRSVWFMGWLDWNHPFIRCLTLPKTNNLHLKMDGWNIIFLWDGLAFGANSLLVSGSVSMSLWWASLKCSRQKLSPF